MSNGSVLYGEVKKLEFAKLTLDTDDFGLIDIDWDPIASMTAPGPFIVMLANGSRVRGSIVLDSTGVTISGPPPVTVPRSQIGSFEDFDVGFWNRMSVNLDFGANVARGNNRVTSLSSGLSVVWESDKTEVFLRGSSLINEQEDSNDTRRYTASVGVDRETLRRLRVGLTGSFERDENQELERRTLATLYLGYRAISKQRARLDIIAGGGPTFEKFTGQDPESVGEGRAGFAFIGRPNGDTDIDLSAYLYPTLFDFDRVRIESDLVFRIEIIDDLTFNITSFYRFNSEPPEGVDKSDYGVTVGIGWSY
jgi:putative salt-induced outer membrane protein YdiY